MISAEQCRWPVASVCVEGCPPDWDEGDRQTVQVCEKHHNLSFGGLERKNMADMCALVSSLEQRNNPNANNPDQCSKYKEDKFL